MCSNSNDKSSVFPSEMPAENNKELRHGAIVDVVKNEINVPHSQNPVTPADTDALNTEFAKKSQQAQQ